MKGFTKSANQKVKAKKIVRDAPAKRVIAGTDLRAKKATK